MTIHAVLPEKREQTLLVTGRGGRGGVLRGAGTVRSGRRRRPRLQESSAAEQDYHRPRDGDDSLPGVPRRPDLFPCSFVRTRCGCGRRWRAHFGCLDQGGRLAQHARRHHGFPALPSSIVYEVLPSWIVSPPGTFCLLGAPLGPFASRSIVTEYLPIGIQPILKDPSDLSGMPKDWPFS